MSLFINNKNKYFVKSNYIKVFPCAYRGEGINVEAKLNTEYNFTHSSGILGRNSYIADTSYDKSNDLCVLPFVFTIDGYVFEIFADSTAENLHTELANMMTGDATEVYAHILPIAVDDSGIPNSTVLSNLSGTTPVAGATLDIDSEGTQYFTGVCFTTASELFDGESKSLKIYKKINSNAQIAYESVLPAIKAFDKNQISVGDQVIIGADKIVKQPSTTDYSVGTNEVPFNNGYFSNINTLTIKAASSTNTSVGEAPTPFAKGYFNDATVKQLNASTSKESKIGSSAVPFETGYIKNLYGVNNSALGQLNSPFNTAEVKTINTDRCTSITEPTDAGYRTVYASKIDAGEISATKINAPVSGVADTAKGFEKNRIIAYSGDVSGIIDWDFKSRSPIMPDNTCTLTIGSGKVTRDKLADNTVNFKKIIAIPKSIAGRSHGIQAYLYGTTYSTESDAIGVSLDISDTDTAKSTGIKAYSAVCDANTGKTFVESYASRAHTHTGTYSPVGHTHDSIEMQATGHVSLVGAIVPHYDPNKTETFVQWLPSVNAIWINYPDSDNTSLAGVSQHSTIFIPRNTTSNIEYIYIPLITPNSSMSYRLVLRLRAANLSTSPNLLKLNYVVQFYDKTRSTHSWLDNTNLTLDVKLLQIFKVTENPSP